MRQVGRSVPAALLAIADRQLHNVGSKQLFQIQQRLQADVFESFRAGFASAIAAGLQSMPPAAFVPPPRIGFDISFNCTVMAPLTYPKPPEVDPDFPADWAKYSQAIESRVTGNDANRNAVSGGGQNIWRTQDGDLEERAAVGWALQQNPNLRYDADRKQFFVSYPDGATQDVASKDEVVNVIRKNGGANPGNGPAMKVVSSFLQERVGSQTHDSVSMSIHTHPSFRCGNRLEWLLHGKCDLLGFSPDQVHACLAGIKSEITALLMAILGLQTPAASMNPINYPKAPGVNTEADWPAYSKAIGDRLTGSKANKLAVDGGGQNIWTMQGGNLDERAAVGWALQQNQNLRYDTDRKQFFLSYPDGSTKDVASLGNVVNVIRQNGGANQNNAAGMKAVGSYLNGLTQNGSKPQTPPAPPFGTFAFMAMVRHDLLHALMS